MSLRVLWNNAIILIVQSRQKSETKHHCASSLMFVNKERINNDRSQRSAVARQMPKGTLCAVC